MAKNSTKKKAMQPDVAEPLRGIEALAWWSVPTLGVVAICCTSTLAYLYFNRHEPNLAHSAGSVAIEQTTATQQPTKTKLDTPSSKVSSSFDSPNLTEKSTSDLPARNDSVSSSSPIVTHLTCNAETNSIEFSGDGAIRFAPDSPSLEMTVTGYAKDAWLVFDGISQAIEIPPISKKQGTLSLVVKIPEKKATSIFFDSSLQRLTLRKNDKGLRWRVAAGRKPVKIRLLKQSIDFARWQHLVITWVDGKEAILHINGTIVDRHDYVNEQPQSPSYNKVVLGKTRAPNGDYYRCKIAELKILRDVLSPQEIEELHHKVVTEHPALF